MSTSPSRGSLGEDDRYRNTLSNAMIETLQESTRLRAQAADLRGLLSDAENTVAQLRAANNDLKKRLTLAGSDSARPSTSHINLDEPNQRIREENILLTQRLKSAEDELARAEAFLTDAQSRIEGLHAEKESLSQRISKSGDSAIQMRTLMEDKATLSRRVLELEEEKKRILGTLNRAQTRLNVLETELDSKLSDPKLRSELTEAKDRAEKMNTEHSNLVSRLEYADNRRIQAEARVAELESKLRLQGPAETTPAPIQSSPSKLACPSIEASSLSDAVLETFPPTRLDPAGSPTQEPASTSHTPQTNGTSVHKTSTIPPREQISTPAATGQSTSPRSPPQYIRGSLPSPETEEGRHTHDELQSSTSPGSFALRPMIRAIIPAPPPLASRRPSGSTVVAEEFNGAVRSGRHLVKGDMHAYAHDGYASDDSRSSASQAQEDDLLSDADGGDDLMHSEGSQPSRRLIKLTLKPRTDGSRSASATASPLHFAPMSHRGSFSASRNGENVYEQESVSAMDQESASALPSYITLHEALALAQSLPLACGPDQVDDLRTLIRQVGVMKEEDQAEFKRRHMNTWIQMVAVTYWDQIGSESYPRGLYAMIKSKINDAAIFNWGLGSKENEPICTHCVKFGDKCMSSGGKSDRCRACHIHHRQRCRPYDPTSPPIFRGIKRKNLYAAESPEEHDRDPLKRPRGSFSKEPTERGSSVGPLSAPTGGS